jgi:hypothetical protein
MDADRARYEAGKDGEKDGGGDLPAHEYYAELIEITQNARNIIRWCCKDYQDTIHLETKSNAGLLDDLVYLYESLHTPCRQDVFDDISGVLSTQIERLRAAFQDILPTLAALENKLTPVSPPQEEATRRSEPSY